MEICVNGFRKGRPKMKKFLKISFISLSVFVLSFIVVAVLLSNKVSASNDDVKEDGDKETKDINERVNWIKKSDEKVHADALRNIRNGVDRSDELKKFDEISQKKLYDAAKNLRDAKADKREKLQELKDAKKQEKAAVKSMAARGLITNDEKKRALGSWWQFRTRWQH